MMILVNDSGEFDDDAFLLTAAIEDVGFQYAPLPGSLREVISPYTYVCALFTTG